MRVGGHDTPRDDVPPAAELRQRSRDDPVAATNRRDLDFAALAVEHPDRSLRRLHGLAEGQSDLRRCLGQLRARRGLGGQQLRVGPGGAGPEDAGDHDRRDCRRDAEQSRLHLDAPISSPGRSRAQNGSRTLAASRIRLARVDASDLRELEQRGTGWCRPGTRTRQPSRRRTAPTAVSGRTPGDDRRPSSSATG